MATATRFHSLEELIEGLRARQVERVSLVGRVATSTSPGGKRITFRGQVVVAADLGGRQTSRVRGTGCSLCDRAFAA